MHAVSRIRFKSLLSKGFCLGGLLLWAGLSENARGTVVTFNWPSSPGWTAGTPAPGQTRSQTFTSFYPNDISVSINNNGAGPQGMVFNGGYPQISATPVNGGTVVNGLQLFVSSSQVSGAYTEVTINFATPVIDLSLQLWDIDRTGGSYTDRISTIRALNTLGATVGPDSVTSAVPGFNTITGTGLATVVTGTATAANNSNQGTIDITFNGPITQFSFRWNNADPALGSQGVAIGSLIYTPVPETSPALVVAFCLMAAGLESARRRMGRRLA